MVGGSKPLGESVFAVHAVAGAAAISASAVAVYPLDTVKTLLQLGATGQKQKMGLRQVVDRLMAASGPAGFYNGIGWSILGKLPGLGARFGTYELLTAFYKDGREDNYVYYSEAMKAGIAAGAVEAVFCTPFELFKLRNQHPWMLTGSGKPPLPSDVHLPSRVILLEGWGALWRGLRSGIARDCVFGGMFFSTWQFLHTVMLTWKAVNMSPKPRNLEAAGPVPPFASSVAAGFAGAIAAAASHTFDTAKSRSECTVVPKYIAMERKFLKWKAPGTWIERKTGISPADRNVLFRGIGLRTARSGIASFVLVGSYYLAVNHLS
uniref:Mitochondrial carrier protein n=2 Tax=Zea mays TaxID=4577 RepID=A0A804RKQ5_MAIZE